MKIGSFLALLLGLAVPLPLAGQDDRRPDRPPLPGPVEVLLTNRTSLGLGAEQVARLEQIEREMEESNRQPVMRLLELRREGRELRGRRSSRDAEPTPAQRERLDRLMEEAQPLLARIRENNRAAMEKVGEVLTRDQKVQLRELLRERRNEEGRRRRGPDRERDVR